MTLDQQVDLLVRRGMIVKDRPRALHHLQHINYYRLRAYWLPDEIDCVTEGDHTFSPGTKFDDILDLYTFDRKLRLLVMDAIERVEVSLRTGWAHKLAVRYGAHAHEDQSLFRDVDKHNKCLNNLKAELGRSHETFVSHHRERYPDHKLPPIWVSCEVLSFGQLSVWYENLAHGNDRRDIAEPYRVDEQILVSFAHHLTYVRNVCAHHSRLWNREMTITMKLPRRPATLEASFNPNMPRRSYNTLTMLALMLSTISTGSAWCAQLLKLLEEHPSVDLASMGFRADWRRLSLWQTAAGDEPSP